MIILTCPSEQLRRLIDPVSEFHKHRGRGQKTQHHRGRVNLTINGHSSLFSVTFSAPHHVCLDGAGGVVQGQAAGVVPEVPRAQGSDPQTEHLALLAVNTVNAARLHDGHIVPGPGHLHHQDYNAGIGFRYGDCYTVTVWCLCLQT